MGASRLGRVLFIDGLGLNSCQQVLITEVVARELEKKFPAQTYLDASNNPGNKTFASVVAKCDNKELAQNKPEPEAKNQKSRAPSKNRAKLIKKKRTSSCLSSPKKLQQLLQRQKQLYNQRLTSEYEHWHKKVKPIGNGGILVETDSEKDLDKLLEEFRKQDELTKDFVVNKPAARKTSLNMLQHMKGYR
ncbi:hypothetical protein CEXT_526921 [Caerostris extrusa]|uniref:Uncharacterized protein n=1 Tax=Caerostris extrusa TaxID=172846 RepID=A0AAV4VCD5_CAEEX|nr:hypothetical protein CEXT_526921 [Caerostris extrusa]